MDDDGADNYRVMLDAVTTETGRVRRLIDQLVAFKWAAGAGAFLAAVAPALMATEQGAQLEGSVSAYWDVDPEYYFLGPFTAAAVLIFIDGALSYLSPNKDLFGRRWFNLVLGVSLFLLTWFNKDDTPGVHYPAAYVFFVLFISVIAYTSALAWFGKHTGDGDHPGRQVEVATARVSVVFLVLLVLTLIAWLIGWITFYFFEVFALVNFALFYVQGFFYAFPYNHYEFKWSWLNQLLRTLRIMRMSRS